MLPNGGGDKDYIRPGIARQVSEDLLLQHGLFWINSDNILNDTFQVQGEIGVVVEQAFVVELGGVVERVTRSATELSVTVMQSLLLQCALSLQQLVLGLFQRIVETAEHSEGQDNLLELAFLESSLE